MTRWVKAIEVDELPPGGVRMVELDGTTVALCNVGGRFYALGNTCPHRGGPLGMGRLQEEPPGAVGPGEMNCRVSLVCPLHGWRFDVATGKARNLSGARVVTYPVRVEGTTVIVEIEV